MRIRPLSLAERNTPERASLPYFTTEDQITIYENGNFESLKFDHVLDDQTTQEDMFK